MSLQREKSESTESAERDDRRALRFSFGEAGSLACGRADRVWRGMLAGLRGFEEKEGILTASPGWDGAALSLVITAEV